MQIQEQIGIGNFNKRRYPSDSKLNINKTLRKQFNLLRVNDNDLFPSYFYLRGKKYSKSIDAHLNVVDIVKDTHQQVRKDLSLQKFEN